jgi:hypothetical protein
VKDAASQSPSQHSLQGSVPRLKNRRRRFLTNLAQDRFENLKIRKTRQ